MDLSERPAGTRLILRTERGHPGAQLRFTDAGGHRVTAFLTDTPNGVIPGQLAGLEMRDRQHARVEDRIRQAKATRLANLPFNSFDANAAWLGIIMAATDLIAWTKLIGFTDHPDRARCKIEMFPLPGPTHRRPHHPQRPTTPAAHRLYLALGGADATAWSRIRTAFTLHPDRGDPTRRKTHRPWEKPGPPERHPATSPCPPATSKPHKPANTGSARPNQAARKIQASTQICGPARFAPDFAIRLVCRSDNIRRVLRTLSGLDHDRIDPWSDSWGKAREAVF